MKFEEVEKLYIVKDGVTYSPQTICERKVDEDGNWYGDHTIVKTAEESYQDCINPSKPEQTTQETLSKEVASLKISDMKKDAVMTNALQTIASLKVEIMGLKGGNV